MEQAISPLRWGTEQRLEFIEFRLFWEGTINRSDITERFSVSVPQASNDLTLYRGIAPENVKYDPRSKKYITSSNFQPKFLKPNPDRYLAQLKGLSDGIIDLDDVWFASAPASGVVPTPVRRIDPEILRALLAASRYRQALHVEYQSMSSPEPQWRWISPHAFAFDGTRWHVRAFCHRRRDFVDFVVGRILATGPTATAEAQSQVDWRWERTFDVFLKPNPELTVGQRRAIALDYGMTDNQVAVAVRYALLYYFEKQLRLDVAEHSNDPRACPVVIENRTAFNEALAAAHAQ